MTRILLDADFPPVPAKEGPERVAGGNASRVRLGVLSSGRPRGLAALPSFLPPPGQTPDHPPAARRQGPELQAPLMVNFRELTGSFPSLFCDVAEAPNQAA